MRVVMTLVVLGLATPALGSEGWVVEGFDAPESALFDAERGRIILSNIGGAPVAADGNGFLSLISPGGEVLDRDWVTGLDSPAGMAMTPAGLLVADAAHLRLIDPDTGEILQSFAPEGAVFLNDVAAADGTAYVSDMMTHSIWRLDAGGEPQLWVQDEALAHPNGLLVDGDRLLVGSWGAGMRDDFTTETPGSLLSLDLGSGAITVMSPEIGNLDGLTRVGDEILASDWMSGALTAIAADGSTRAVLARPQGLADMSAHQGMLYMPRMVDGQLEAVSYP